MPPVSEAHKFPDESNVILVEFLRLVADVSGGDILFVAPDVKSVCPSATVAAPPVERLAVGYFRIRLLPLSATHKFPDESNVIPVAFFMVVAVIPCTADVKSDCPSATVAAPPVERLAVGYFRIRLLPGSVAHKFPDESNAILVELFRVVAVIPCSVDVKSVCPSATVAAPPVTRLAAGYFRIRKLPVSATHIFPDESNVIPVAFFMVVAVLPLVLDVKSVCPSATVAAPPGTRLAAGYFRIRLLPVSAIHKFPDESNANPFGA